MKNKIKINYFLIVISFDKDKDNKLNKIESKLGDLELKIIKIFFTYLFLLNPKIITNLNCILKML